MNNKKNNRKKTKYKILIRMAGGRKPSKELGFGHVFRSINLASQIMEHDIFFLIEDYGGIKKILSEKKIKKIFFLKKKQTLDYEINRSLSIINKEKIDLMIIDRYKIKKSFVSKIHEHVKTVVISDLRLVDFKADLVVNGFIGFDNKIIFNKYGTKCLLGPSHQILDERFSQRKKNKNPKIDILATFGGSDEKNLTDVFVKSIQAYLKKLKVKLILGPENKKNLDLFYPKKRSNNLKIIEKTSNMPKEITNSKFGFCSGGITCYEFASLKIPFAIITQIKHQQTSAREWQKKGFAVNLGMPSKSLDDKISLLIQQILKGSKIGKSPKIRIDGNGSKRVAQEILNLLKKRNSFLKH